MCALVHGAQGTGTSKSDLLVVDGGAESWLLPQPMLFVLKSRLELARDVAKCFKAVCVNSSRGADISAPNGTESSDLDANGVGFALEGILTPGHGESRGMVHERHQPIEGDSLRVPVATIRTIDFLRTICRF